MSGDSSPGGAGGSSQGDCEGGEQDEPSSLSPDLQVTSGINALEIGDDATDKINTNDNVEDVLSTFRQQWQKELGSPSRQTILNGQNRTKASDDPSRIDDCLSPESDEEKAKNLFLKGVEHERNGKFYDAIKFYKRAEQLVPDIEFKLYESTLPKSKGGHDETPEWNSPERTDLEGGDHILEAGELLAKIEKMVMKSGSFCHPEFDQKSTHISSLPTELVLYILRWVVSSELDLMSLEHCANVCRGFYLCARDQEIWRLVCIKTWGINCGSLKTYGFPNWRQMFIDRPRLRYNGCYISKTTYMRHGENSFQDQFYRPWHLIEYYRYLRFFPDGVVLMQTTADEPALCCSNLKQRTSRATGVLSGIYRLHSDKVIIIVKKLPPSNMNKQFQSSNTRFRSRRKDTQEVNLEQTFHLELQIQSQRSRRFCSLSWCGYTVFIKNSSGIETSSSFEIVKSKFPPFSFSRVKSYHAEADSPLQ